MTVQYLELADFLLIAEAITGTPAEDLARTDRTVHLAESALAAPAASYGGREFYPDLATKRLPSRGAGMIIGWSEGEGTFRKENVIAFTERLPDVCESCNGGWMKDIEDLAIPAAGAGFDQRAEMAAVNLRSHGREMQP